MSELSQNVLVWVVAVAGLMETQDMASLQAAQGLDTPASGLMISEFLASNDRGLRDEEGDYSDWIEIHNASASIVDLEGWYLTDDLGDLKQWEFPAVVVEPGGYLVVFASGKNERDPQDELHTSFSLSSGGESAALVEPDGETVAHAYADYPRQFADISYGLGSGGFAGQTETVLVAAGASARALIPTSGVLGSTWKEPAFDDSQWLSGTTGVGYDYPGLVGLDVGAMRGVNQTVYVRIPFHVEDVESVDRLILRLKYEDGFVACLNGYEVARANAPETPEEADLPWNAGATATRDDNEAVGFQEFDLTADKNWLIQGDNLLAFQGLNTTLTSSDLLILPELVAIDVEHVDLSGVVQGYLLQPTPGAANDASLAQIGPAIRDVTENPPAPRAGEDLVITARVAERLAPVLAATMTYVVNFDFDSRTPRTGTLLMTDDGTGSDAVAGDGIYTAAIPGTSFDAGDMVRWYVNAIDAEAQMSRNPLFPYPDDSPEYYGTVVQDPTIDTPLPVFCWFVQNVGASESRSGTRGSLYCFGQFYDNVKIAIRGGSTAGLPTKHFKFWANHGYKFQYREDAPRVDEFRLNNTYSDKAYLRQALAFESYDWCGCPGSEAFPVRAERNGEFYAVQIFIEEPEEELLEREGLDPDGALYKMYNTFNVGGSAEKKTRRWEGRQDLDDFCRSINNASGATRHNNIFDQVDLPRTLGYLVATILCHQNDHPHKNHFLYRDSDGSGQWCFLPWDHDLTWGSNWTGSSLHDYIYAADDQVPGKPTDVKPSHPFVGKQDCQEWNYHWNRMIDALLNDATVREMYLRRLRTVMDDFLQPPVTPYDHLFIENRIDELVALMASDVALDYAKYANPWSWGGQGGYPRDQSFAYALNVLKNDYLAVRRTHLFVTHNVDRVAYYNIPGSYSAAIPNAQPANATIMFGAVEFNPSSGNQDEEYIEFVNPNTYTVDVSDWQLSGGVEHAFLPGTVIVAGGRMYVTPDTRAFLNRASSPRGGEGRFAQGNYKGHLSSWGETLTLTDRSGRTVATLTYAGNPSEQQRYLRVSEVMYHPAAGGAFDADEYEFIELTNIGPAPLLLDGAKLTDGVSYVFEEGRNAMLAPGAYIVIAKNRVAFTARYGSGINLAPGQYSGGLSNSGETITLDNATNSTILEFKYVDGWYDETDGQGASLTIIDSAHPNFDAWDTPEAWQPSSEPRGSPGIG
ncbi:MAG: lamin tail domain-containing protein [Sedimentisphaerales bacterium]|nr:lamin tail domain-containing protein [Sedimentisphaerales bacterium]